MTRRFAASAVNLFFFVLLISPSSHAMKLSPLVGAGLEFGGEKIVDVTYKDGSKSDIEAGRGLLIFGGALLNLSETTPHTFEAQATLGLKWTGTKQASNGEVSFFRWPIELLSFYRNTENNFRIGGGITYQFGNELEGTQDASAASLKLKDAAGFVIEGDYFVGTEKNMAVGLRYTSINYEPKDGGDTIKGNSFGVNLTYIWF